jgi:hypothetical protein
MTQRQRIGLAIIIAFVVLIGLAVYFSRQEQKQLIDKCSSRGLVPYEIEHTTVCREPATGQLYAPQ